MQSRRREEHVTVSPASKLRAQQRLELVPDAYRSTRRDGSDQSPAQQRIMSPQKLDGLRRGVGGNKGNISFERRDYNRGSDTFERKDYNEGSDTFDRRGYDYNLGGHRCSQVESRSPPIEQARKRPQIDEGVRHRSCSPPLGLRARYELPQSRDYKDDEENLVAKRVYGYEHVNYSVNREKEFIEARLVDGQGMLDHKLMINDDAVRGSYRLSDTDITSQYEETGGHLPPLSRSVGMVRIEHERPQHRNTLPSDKLAGVESYRSGEKLRYNARDGPYSMMSSSYPKDLGSASQMMDYGSSSLGTSRTDSVCSHRDGNHLRASYELPRSSGKHTDTLGFSGYEQRLPMDTSKDPETRQRTMTCPQQCVYSPNRTKHEEYLNTKLPVTAQVEHGYQCDDIPRRIAPHVQLDYEEAPMKYENREFCRPSMHPVLDTTDRDEDSYATHRRGDLHDHPALQKEKYYDCADMRTLISSKQGDDYLSPGYAHPEIGKRLSQDHEISYLGASEGGRVLILRPEYESRREGGPGLQHERFHISPFSSHNLETQRRGVRMHEIKQDPGINDHADTTLKRKYNVDEHIDVHGSRITKSSKWNSHEDVYENEEWLDEGMDVMYSSGNVGFDHKIYRKDNRDYTGLDNEEDYPSDGWLSNQDSLQHQQRRSVKFRTYYGPNVKSHPKFNSSSWYRSQHFSKGSAIPKQSKPWKQHHGYDNVHTNNEESSEDWKDATQSEPSEGSEEFMQMAHEAFLMYSKKLNLNSSVQRRYKDQGKAGSLYCIVCGRSSSKEFMDTQRLVTHAFMSHKAGLRAKHLGLHKAICVLLGWDTVVPQDTITWFPQVLPNDEAMAQKEDLILWPPLVIIHNITMSDDNPQKWKVVSMETIEAFLRGKGFVRGRIKLCLGRPADQSIILVKFLGTFIGLGDAERLHKYLSDSNRGRVEFERIKSKNGRSHEIGESGIHEDNVEHLLYGYMGIAEDLDKLDFNTKKWSLIKSKKEIEDLDNDPIKTSER